MKSLHSNPLSLALASLLALASPLSTLRAFTWSASGLDGAGTQNCVAIQPGGTGVILSAADVSGIQRSTDNGSTWKGANNGVPAGGPGKVATVTWSNSTTHAGVAYAGDLDGFLSSTDAGATWTLLSGVPSFQGNGGTIRWPRSTGNLIACDQSAAWPGTLYCGAVNSAGTPVVMRSTDGGSTWTTIFTSPSNTEFIRSLALDPSNPSTLYAATFGDYVWKTTSAKTATGNTNWFAMSGGPDQPEELLVLTDGTLYAAGSDSSAGGGVWKWTSASAWTSLTVPTASGTTYLGITGYGTGATATLYASASSAATSGDDHASVIKTVNGGSTWTNITQTANVVDQIGGAGGPSWWQMQPNAGSYYELGAASGDMASIQVDPSNHDRVITSGRAGIWETTNATAANTSIRWYPYVNGLSVCVANWACIDPNHPGRVYVTDEDWTFFCSTDSGKTFVRSAANMTSGTTGRPIYVDPTNSKVYCGQLSSSSGAGDVYSNPDPTTGQNWTSEGFAAAVGSGGAAVRGVISGKDGSGNTVILACANSQGVWRKDGATWALANASIVPSGASVVQFAWNPGSAYVFVYAQGTGLWRSTNYGASFTKIWSTTSGSGPGVGFVAEDPSQEGRLYVSTTSGVFRFADARTGTTFTPTNLGGPANPGAMTLANGFLYCCNGYTTGAPASLYRWLSPATSVTSAIISSGDYTGQSEWPSGIAVDSNGTIYLSERDEGCMTGSPLLYADNFASGAGNWTADGGTWSVVTAGGSSAYQGASATSSALAYLNYSGSSSWQSYALSADVTPVSFTTGSCGVSLNFVDANNRYMLQITPTGGVNIKSDNAGTQTTLASGTYTYTSGHTYTLELVANNLAGTLTAYINGTQVAQATGITFTPSAGTAALNVFEGTADFDNVLVDQL